MPGKDDFRVNALIIGAGRSGTTSLYRLLDAHSGVCFSNVKEVNYFSLVDLYRKGERYYHAFFRKCKKAPVAVSADTYLLMDYDAIRRIHAYNPEMKLIVILRDPVERAYSSYNYSVNYGHHGAYADFLDSIEAEQEIREEQDIVNRNNRGHFYGGLYYEHLSRWIALFSREQILLLKTSDLKESPQKLTRILFSFLGVPDPHGTIERKNVSGAPRSKKVERLFIDRDHVVRRLLRRSVPRFMKNLIIGSGIVDRLHEANRIAQPAKPLTEEQVLKAREYFSEDLRLLKEEFQIDLIHS